MRYTGSTDISAVVFRDPLGVREVAARTDGRITIDVVESAPTGKYPVEVFIRYLWIYDDDQRIAVISGNGAVYRVGDGRFAVVLDKEEQQCE